MMLRWGPEPESVRYRFLVAALLLLASRRADAIRPFITDDARVVGRGLIQLETWVFVDRTGVQHWIFPAFGPTDFLELTVGVVHGVGLELEPTRYALAAPLFQAKVLARPHVPNSWPGLAFAGGAFAPFGLGQFRLTNWAGFGYLSLTESLFSQERLLIHANLGFALVQEGAAGLRGAVTGGVGTQVRVVRGLHFVGEVVYGDPYRAGGGAAFQTGFRYILNDYIQIDTTVGYGLSGEERAPLWGSAGLRLVSSPLW
jgi:hypothetical protein